MTTSEPRCEVHPPREYKCPCCGTILGLCIIQGSKYYVCPICNPHAEIDFDHAFYESCMTCEIAMPDDSKIAECGNCHAYRCKECAQTPPRIRIDGSELFPDRPVEYGTTYYFCDEKCKKAMLDSSTN